MLWWHFPLFVWIPKPCNGKIPDVLLLPCTALSVFMSYGLFQIWMPVKWDTAVNIFVWAVATLITASAAQALSWTMTCKHAPLEALVLTGLVTEYTGVTETEAMMATKTVKVVLVSYDQKWLWLYSCHFVIWKSNKNSIKRLQIVCDPTAIGY